VGRRGVDGVSDTQHLSHLVEKDFAGGLANHSSSKKKLFR
jgi:hypothetical protein